MKTFNDYMKEYGRQMEKGDIPEAYRRLMNYLSGLRTYFDKTYPDFFVSGQLYQGYMDMSYFAIVPEDLKKRKLKIAVVFIHESMRFEAWLSGANRNVQKKYWNSLKERGFCTFFMPESPEGRDSIVETVLVEEPGFDDPDALTKRIEDSVLSFNQKIVDFFEKVNL